MILKVVSLLFYATIVASQVYYEVTTGVYWSYTRPPTPEPSFKLRMDNVRWKYFHETSASISGFDKEMVHKQNLGLITVNSELSLKDCKLYGLDHMETEHVYHEGQVHGFDITQGIIIFPLLTIKCNIVSRQQKWYRSATLLAVARKTPADLTIVQNRESREVTLTHKLLQSPKVRLTVDSQEVWRFVSRYFNNDLTLYLADVMRNHLITTVASNLKIVAEEFS